MTLTEKLLRFLFPKILDKEYRRGFYDGHHSGIIPTPKAPLTVSIFITGPQGAGKTTLKNKLKTLFQNAGYDYIFRKQVSIGCVSIFDGDDVGAIKGYIRDVHDLRAATALFDGKTPVIIKGMTKPAFDEAMKATAKDTTPTRALMLYDRHRPRRRKPNNA